MGVSMMMEVVTALHEALNIGMQSAPQRCAIELTRLVSRFWTVPYSTTGALNIRRWSDMLESGCVDSSRVQWVSYL
jgi:hypothetical protein